MTPFNLSQEREEGYFAASGDFVWKKVDRDDTDAWLESLGKESLSTFKVGGCMDTGPPFG